MDPPKALVPELETRAMLSETTQHLLPCAEIQPFSEIGARSGVWTVTPAVRHRTQFIGALAACHSSFAVVGVIVSRHRTAVSWGRMSVHRINQWWSSLQESFT